MGDEDLETGNALRWIHGRITGRPMNFSFIDDKVSGCACPTSKREVDWLRNVKNIGAILSVREGPLVSSWIERLQYLNVEVRNHHPPTLEQLRICVNFILRESESGSNVAVHCAAGQGRTGTVLAAYLCNKKNLSAENSIKMIRSQRPHSIEKVQEKVIQDYYRDLKGGEGFP